MHDQITNILAVAVIICIAAIIGLAYLEWRAHRNHKSLRAEIASDIKTVGRDELMYILATHHRAVSQLVDSIHNVVDDIRTSLDPLHGKVDSIRQQSEAKAADIEDAAKDLGDAIAGKPDDSEAGKS